MNLIQNHLSFSAINQFDTCPKSWFSQRVLGKKQVAGDAASFGLAFEDGVLKTLKIPNEKEPEGDDRAAVEGQMLREVNAAVEKYLGTANSLAQCPPGTLVAQRKIEITPEQWGTMADCYGAAGEIHLPIIGYIDVLHTDPMGLRRTVYDLKTTSDSRMKETWMLQVILYALVERAQKVEIHALIKPPDRPTKKPRPEGWVPNFQTALYAYRPTDSTFQWAMTRLAFYAGLMRQAEKSSLDRMPAKPSYACAWCPEKDACEARMIAEVTPFAGTKLTGAEE